MIRVLHKLKNIKIKERNLIISIFACFWHDYYIVPVLLIEGL